MCVHALVYVCGNVCVLAVLTGSGSFNPLTRMHVRLFYLAKQFMETKHGYVVLGSLLSPAHRYVLGQYPIIAMTVHPLFVTILLCVYYHTLYRSFII